MHAGILVSLITLITWGATDYMSAQASRKFSPFVINFAFVVYFFPMSTVLCIVKGLPPITMHLFLGFLLANLFVTGGFLAMVRGFSDGVIGLVAPLANAYAVVVLLFSVLIFNESISVIQMLVVLLIVASIVLVSYKGDHASKKRAASSVKYGVIGMVLFGVGFALSGHFSQQTNWYGAQLLLGTASLLIAVTLLLIRRKRNELREIKPALKNPFIIVGGTVGAIGALCFFGAVALGTSIVVVATIASASPLLTSYLAHKFDHESLDARQRIGAVMVVACVIVLNLIH